MKEKIEDYRERGHKPNEYGCYEEWSLWLKDNCHLLTISELEEMVRSLRLNENAMNPIYEEHISLCSKALDMKRGYAST